MRNFTATTLALVLFAAIAATAHAQDRTIRHNLLGESVGAAAYDPVSYFPEGGSKPQKGLISIAAEHQGVTYRFSSENNKKLFLASPGKYVPAFGGWCAWAVAELGKRVDVDPLSYEIENGRLLLFYRDPKLDTRAMWRKSPEKLREKAEAAWPKLAH